MTNRAAPAHVGCGNLLVSVGARAGSILFFLLYFIFIMCEAGGRGVHLNVEVRVEGQDSPYQVAAPCWLAELTLNVNLLTMTTMRMKMMMMKMRRRSWTVLRQ